MKRSVAALLCVILILICAAPQSARAASKKTVYILSVENDGARIRSTPNSTDDNVKSSLKKNAKVFYLGKSGAWYKVCSEYGSVGYVYKGYLKYYGAVALSSVRIVAKGTIVYEKPKTSAHKASKFSQKQLVILRASNTNWAYVYTLSGTSGYVKISALKSVK